MSTDTKAPLQSERTVKWSAGDKAFATFSHVVLVVWALLVVGPLIWTFMTSFKTSSEIFASALSFPQELLDGRIFENYVNAWTKGNFGTYFLNTIVVVGIAMVLVMLLGAMCAYVLARHSFPGSQLIYYLMLAGLTFPIFLAIVPLYKVLQSLPLPWAPGQSLLGTHTGLILTYVAFALPFTVFFLYAFFKTLPDEIAEAAAVDGAGEWTTFFRIMLPMAKPGIASVAIFNFLGLWNQYLLPVALNSSEPKYVLAQGIARFASQMGYSTDFGALFAAVIITVVPVLVIYVLFQRQLQGSVSQGTMK
ncbi:carbohydrate ABC transporter permease [Tessaracoccus rhinocerotis]|uniref:Carbohydrate ABC transporter permease n=1 Tax=Tessaracoccus rhinocerotis TaxID=1689449 RepID=A0A553JZF0_9ACTN|nr:carbohydrate ABC transporter permease [Tessaracoccus rhinocerotis]TRY17831.1 carbohydrate ABC transporter permease [Tessaracoccus rhinocerotis]